MYFSDEGKLRGREENAMNILEVIKDRRSARAFKGI